MTVKFYLETTDKGLRYARIQDSTVIKACSYRKSDKRLNITFSNGTIYSFDNVSYARFSRLIKAESVGTYFAKNIKGKYISTKRTFIVEHEVLHSLSRSFR